MAITGTDLMMVERDGVLHKGTAQEVADLNTGGGGGVTINEVLARAFLRC